MIIQASGSSTAAVTFEPGDVDVRDDDPELRGKLDGEEVLGGAAEEHRRRRAGALELRHGEELPEAL